MLGQFAREQRDRADRLEDECVRLTQALQNSEAERKVAMDALQALTAPRHVRIEPILTLRDLEAPKQLEG